MILARTIARLTSRLLVLVSCLAFAGTQAQQPATAAPQLDPNALVAEVVRNEVNAKQSGSYMFRDFKQTPDSSSLKELIETKDGTIARTLAVNGKPLTPEQRAQDDQRLQELLADPSKMAAKRKEQKEDEDRVQKMFVELPKAFIYQYDGTEEGKSGPVIRLKFQPNPHYSPSSRETSVYRAMNGSMLVDETSRRLVKIEATLFRDVNFGWGILGHLDKGGHFFVEQGRVGGDDWEPIYTNIQFTGKVLFFKTINMREVETTNDYHRVPNGLTLAQGIELLKKSPDQVAENNAGEDKGEGK